MEITKEILKAVMPNVEANIRMNGNFKGADLDKIVSLMNRYAEEFEINTPARWANYLAQIAHESGELRYSAEIASGQNYEGRKDLGNVYVGDGKKYKGRGLIQLTGRANYRLYKLYCGFDVIEQPELLAKPVGATRSSMWFWKTHGLNELADKGQFRLITRRINGGYNGIEQRWKYLTRATKALNVK